MILSDTSGQKEDGRVFEVTVYNLGDLYVASRSNEFGYAN